MIMKNIIQDINKVRNSKFILKYIRKYKFIKKYKNYYNKMKNYYYNKECLYDILYIFELLSKGELKYKIDCIYDGYIEIHKYLDYSVFNYYLTYKDIDIQIDIDINNQYIDIIFTGDGYKNTLTYTYNDIDTSKFNNVIYNYLREIYDICINELIRVYLEE